jgi:lysophospholipase L1-like esterase
VGGRKLRIYLSNEHSTDSLEIRSIYIANLGADQRHIAAESATQVTFMTERSVTIPAGGVRLSDPIDFEISPLQRVSITISYGHVPQPATIHSGSRTNSFIISGEADFAADFSGARAEQHWYSIVGLDVLTATPTECIACLGNSITDGRGVTIDADNRWTDVLAEQLGGEVGVLNLGIGGNCVLSGGLGPTAKERFATDVLQKSGVTKVIVFEGVNDIGSKNATDKTADQLIKTYKWFIRKSHNAGLRIYGATITPMMGSDYYSPAKEAIRCKVNDWILNSGEFDGVLDISAIVANPSNSAELRPEYQYDALHPNPAGYKAIGQYVANYFKQETIKQTDKI